MRSIRMLTTGLILLVMGIALIVITGGEMIDYNKKGADYSTLTTADIREGMMIEGELPYNYGWYEKIVDDDKNQSIGYYYLIDAGSEYYMGLYTPVKDLISSLDTQYDEWYYASTEAEYDAITPVTFKGKVTKMDSEDSKFIREYLVNSGFSEEEADAYVIDLYIKCVDTQSHPLMLVIGIIASVAGLIFVLLFVRRKLMGR